MRTTPATRTSWTTRSTRATHGDAGFAILYTLIFVMLLTSFSLLMLSQITSEVRATQFSRKHEQTLNSAMAGLNAGLSKIRNSITLNTGLGVIALIPCTVGSNHGSLAGATDAAGSQTWSTDIYYLASDPSQLTLSQVQAAALPCPLSILPSFAYLIASGAQTLPGSPPALGNRTVHATYKFSTSNATSSGGQISYNNMCWDAGSAPAAGSPVTFQPCLAGGTPSQNWYYRPDLSLQWYGDPTRNLCLDSRSMGTAAPIKYMTVETCIGTGLPGTAYNSITGSYPLAGQMYQEYSTNLSWNNVVAGGDRGSSCINSYGAGVYGLAAAGDQLVMSGTCSGAGLALATAGVGAGAASGISTGLPGPTQQLVNLAQFSRCLDVAGSNPSNGIISYPCHQAPDLTKVEGNQQYQYYGTTLTPGPIQTSRPGYYGTVCLQGGAATVTLVTCQLGLPSQQWTMTGYVIGHYETSYEITDNRGYCLTAATPGGAAGTISLGVCTGLSNQKWNAPPGGAHTQLDAVGEQ